MFTQRIESPRYQFTGEIMIPKLICFIFGHVRFGKTNFKTLRVDRYDTRVTWENVYLKYCKRCGVKLSIEQEK